MQKIIRLTIALLIISTLLLPLNAQEGALLVEGGKKVNVNKSTLILTGDITVKDDSQLFVENSLLQLSIRGEKTYNASISDTATFILTNSTLETLSPASNITLSGQSTMNIINSNITGFNRLLSSNNSVLNIQDGQLKLEYVAGTGEEVNITNSEMPLGDININSSKIKLWEMVGDNIFFNVSSCTLKGVECNLLSGRSDQSLFLNESRVKDCYLQSDGEVVVTDSLFNSLTFLSSGIAVNALTGVINPPKTKTKILWNRAGGPIFAANNTIIQRYWYLKIRLVDESGTPIPAIITLVDYYNNTVFTGKANTEGIFQKPVLAEIVNGSKTSFIGNYRIKANYLNYTIPPTPLTLDGNRDIELQFKGNIPLETTTILTVTPLSVKVGDPVKIKGWISTSETDEYVAVYATGPKGAQFQSAFKTIEKGEFGGEIQLDIEGQWVVYADWLGGANQGISTTSRAFTITVEPRPSIMSLFIRLLPVIIIVVGILGAFAFLALGGLKRGKI